MRLWPRRRSHNLVITFISAILFALAYLHAVNNALELETASKQSADHDDHPSTAEKLSQTINSKVEMKGTVSKSAAHTELQEQLSSAESSSRNHDASTSALFDVTELNSGGESTEISGFNATVVDKKRRKKQRNNHETESSSASGATKKLKGFLYPLILDVDIADLQVSFSALTHLAIQLGRTLLLPRVSDGKIGGAGRLYPLDYYFSLDQLNSSLSVAYEDETAPIRAAQMITIFGGKLATKNPRQLPSIYNITASYRVGLLNPLQVYRRLNRLKHAKVLVVEYRLGPQLRLVETPVLVPFAEGWSQQAEDFVASRNLKVGIYWVANPRYPMFVLEECVEILFQTVPRENVFVALSVHPKGLAKTSELLASLSTRAKFFSAVDILDANDDSGLKWLVDRHVLKTLEKVYAPPQICQGSSPSKFHITMDE